MNDFMNALYNAIGSEVTGFYDGLAFQGRIESVRAKAGNDLSVAVRTTDDDLLLLSGEDLYNGSGKLTANLHVYF